MQIKYTLGLDLGANSIGWCVLDIENQFIDSGVRVFPAGLDQFNSGKEEHPNQSRRINRGIRRSIKRKAKIKEQLRKTLDELNWIPKEEKDIKAWEQLNVYELRDRAIREKVELLELGRIVLHLAQRRGFLSLRKSDERKDKDSKGMLGEISELEKTIKASGKQTLGAYLHELYKENKENIRIRNRHIRRQMIYDEFDTIWKFQTQFYPEILNDSLRFGMHGQREKKWTTIKPERRDKEHTCLEQFGLENLLFFQRSVYWKESSIGDCEYEEGEKRAPKADRRFQEFSMLSEVNNLKIIDSSQGGRPIERPLTEEERAIVLDRLYNFENCKFNDLRKHICKANPSLLEEHIVFNLEGGDRKSISGMLSDYRMKSPKILGKKWLPLEDGIKNQIIEILTKPSTDDEAIVDALKEVEGCEFTDEDIENILYVKLPTAYGLLSIKALEKIIPFLKKGYLYSTKDESQSALHLAGYSRRDQEAHTGLDLLPSYTHNDFKHLKEINNPVVNRCLTELRKVVNGLIQKYGKPETIHIEMIRHLKLGPQKRRELISQNRKREKERNEAGEELEQYNIVPTRASVDLYLLWKEQGEQCVYSGRTISFSQLISGEVDVDHICPGRYLDNSYMNKVLCFRSENADKGQKLPYEWLAENNPERYEEILQRIKLMKLPYPKQKRFWMKELDEGFIQRDLNDTAWISKAACQYLALLFDKKDQHKVLGIKGQMTSQLREHWRLNKLLRLDDKDSKNREDHRHHALDAIVVACSNPSLIQAFSNIHNLSLCFEKSKKEEGKMFIKYQMEGEDRLKLPWESFRESVMQSLNAIWVSHRPQKKISGPLHQETNYGFAEEGVVVIRKPIGKLTDKEIAHIRDRTIAQAVDRHMEDGYSLKDDEHPLTMLSGRPIKKTRFCVPAKDAVVIRPNHNPKELVRPGNTHHLAIYKTPKGKYLLEAVSLLKVLRRLKNQKPIFKKEHQGHPLFMTLSKGETILIEKNGLKNLYVYKTMDSIAKRVSFINHNDCRTENSALIRVSPSKFDRDCPNAKKVVVLPTGEIRDAGV